MDWKPSETPIQIALSHPTDMDDPDTPDFDAGFDVATGFGFIRADWAVDPELLPVELTSFTATPNGANILLEWRTASETSNAGFDVERKRGGEDEWRKIGFVKGSGTTTAPQSYHFTDTAVPFEAETLAYRLRQIDLDGAFEYSPVVELALAAPARFALDPNFPNPFARQTTIRYALPQGGPVRLTVGSKPPGDTNRSSRHGAWPAESTSSGSRRASTFKSGG